MSKLIGLMVFALLLTSHTAQAQAKGSMCMYPQDGILLAKHPNCLVRSGALPLRVSSAQLSRLPFKGRYATIFSWKYGWMYVNREGVVVADHVMNMDNGADHIKHGFVRFTRNGKCGYASLGRDATIAPQFDGCLPFSGSKAEVCTGCRVVTGGEYSWYKGGHSFCINPKGQHISCEPNQSSKRTR